MVATLVVSSFDRFPMPIVTVDGHSTAVWLIGELDLAVVDALRDALIEATTSSKAGRRPSVIVDLSGVTFIDTSTARVLIEATMMSSGTASPLTLRAPSRCVRRMFDLCGSGRLLDAA
jgi:anti-anti-sigma factor